jgi:hypothetical protein
MSGKYHTRRSHENRSLNPQSIQPVPKKGVKRIRARVPSVAESKEVVAGRGTAENGRKRRNRSHTRLAEDPKHPFKKEEDAFMMYLDDLNSDEVFQNREIKKGLFTRYFKETRAGQYDFARETVKAINALLTTRLNTIEMTYEPEDRISAKDGVHKLQGEWRSWFAFLRAMKTGYSFTLFSK